MNKSAHAKKKLKAKNYGRFGIDGRKTVALDISGFNVRASSARHIIDNFNASSGAHFSLTGLTAEVIMLYCKDLGIPYTLTQSPYGGLVNTEIKKL